MIQILINKILGGNTSIAGLRTIIINSIMMILALWDFLSKDGGLFTMLCDSFQFLCNINEGQFWITAMAIITALNNILRWLTVAPVGIQASPAQLIIAHENPSGKQAFATLMVIVSIAVLLIVIVIGFIR